MGSDTIDLMKLIVGLGNPGEKYKGTRHNIGFLVIEKFQIDIFPNFPWKFERKFNAEVSMAGEMILVKPQTFMNNSGGSVSSLASFYKIPKNNIYVIHDDLDIKLGEVKLQFAVGPKLHYGVTSIEEKLGTKDFWRLRIGVDNRELNNRVEGEDYVLQNFSDDEEKIVSEVIIKAVKDLNIQ